MQLAALIVAHAGGPDGAPRFPRRGHTPGAAGRRPKRAPPAAALPALDEVRPDGLAYRAVVPRAYGEEPHEQGPDGDGDRNGVFVHRLGRLHHRRDHPDTLCGQFPG